MPTCGNVCHFRYHAGMTAVQVEPTAVGWTMDDSTFGARLALVRLKMDWNVKQAARECGQAAATWRSWEMDGVEPRRLREVCRAIATRTGCSYLWLLDGPDEGRGTGHPLGPMLDGLGRIAKGRDTKGHYRPLGERMIAVRDPGTGHRTVGPLSREPNRRVAAAHPAPDIPRPTMVRRTRTREAA